MPNVVVVVMPDLGKCQDVLDAWEKYGVSGVTVLESLGMHKLQQMRAQRGEIRRHLAAIQLRFDGERVGMAAAELGRDGH